MTRVTRRQVATIALCMLASFAVVGCDSDDGPLEDAGEAADEAVDDIGDAIKDATDK